MKKLIFTILIICRLISATETEYIIISPPEFLPAAELMANLHHADIAEELQLITAVIQTDSILTNYPDLSLAEAIRQFLLVLIDSNPDLNYLLLLGNEITVPPVYDWYGNPSDDFYTSEIEFQAQPQLSTGRIPAENLEDALSIVEKIRLFTLSPDTGPWRSNFVLFADDAFKSGGGDYNTEITHVANSDSIYQTLKQVLNMQCIYGTDYIPQPGPAWQTLPEMTADVITALNSGIPWISYIGHGNETTLADELIIDMERDLDLISAPEGQLPVWVVGSCDFGHYDYAHCMSEELLLKPDGAIALITPTRDVLVQVISTFLFNFYNNLYNHIIDENDYRIGDLLMVSKNGNTEFHYHLFGDPAMQLPFPKIESLIADNPDTLQILSQSQVVIQNEYQNSPVFLSVYGPEKHITQIYGGVAELSYFTPGDIVFEGEFIDSVQFLLPLDMTFCDTCTASISVYLDTDEATGLIENISEIPIIEQDCEITDLSGPLVWLEYQNTQLNPDDVIFSPYDITIVLQDSSGINLMGALGHDIRFWLDHEENSIILTSEFSYIPGDYTTGTIDLILENVPDGLHNIFIEAWDAANNRSLFSQTVCFSDCSPLEIDTGFLWGYKTSLLTPTGIIQTPDENIYASTSGGILQFSLADGEFTFLLNDVGLDNLDIAAMVGDDFGNIWLSGNTPDGSLQLYHPEFGLQRHIDHIDIDKISKIDIGSERAFAIYQSAYETGIIEFKYDESNLPYFQNHYSSFPVQIDEIRDIDQFGDSVYVTTPQGIWVGNFISDNLTSSSHWHIFAGEFNPQKFIPGDTQFIVTGSSLLKKEPESNWITMYNGISGTIIDASKLSNSENIGILTSSRYYEFDNEVNLLENFPFIIPVASDFTCFDRSEQNIAFGLTNYGILTVESSTMNYELHVPNTLLQNTFNAITVTTENELSGVSKNGMFIFQDDQYFHFIPNAQSGDYYLDNLGAEDFTGMSINYVRGSNLPLSIIENEIGNLIFSNSGMSPSDPATRGGVIEINPETFEFFVYDTTDGILDGLAGIYNQYWTNRYLTINRIQKDPFGNVWVMNPYSEIFNHPAAIQLADGINWAHVTAPDFEAHLPQEIAFDQFGRAWIGLAFEFPMNNEIDEYANGGLRVVDVNNTIADESDDIWLPVLNMDILPGNTVWSLTVDNSGIVWVVTGGGIQGYLYNETDLGLTLIPIMAEPLLSIIPFYKGDHIRTDIHNNKWITTAHSGVFLIRDDNALWPDDSGLNSANSDLLSDIVYDIAFDPAGETAYLSTAKGICSFDISQIPEPSTTTDGDINNDGVTDILDITIVIGIIMETIDPNLYEIEIADMNFDGTLDILDIVWIMNEIIGGIAAKTTPLSKAEIQIVENQILILAEGDVAGIQINVTGDFEIVRDFLPTDWDIFINEKTILIFALNPTNLENEKILEFEGALSISSAIICDWFGNGILCGTNCLLPTAYCLLPPYPNPFNPIVNINYEIPEDCQTQIDIFDLQGRFVKNLISEQKTAGSYSVKWDGNAFASGIYFVKMNANSENLTHHDSYSKVQKIMLVK